MSVCLELKKKKRPSESLNPQLIHTETLFSRSLLIQPEVKGINLTGQKKKNELPNLILRSKRKLLYSVLSTGTNTEYSLWDTYFFTSRHRTH